MLALRQHTVMGRTIVSLWCSSHGPAHCLWSGSAWREGDSQLDLLEAMRAAAAECFSRGLQGLLEDLTDECGL